MNFNKLLTFLIGITLSLRLQWRGIRVFQPIPKGQYELQDSWDLKLLAIHDFGDFATSIEIVYLYRKQPSLVVKDTTLVYIVVI